MRLVSFKKSNEIKIGLVQKDGATVVDLSIAAPDLPADMNGFIDLGQSAMDQAAAASAEEGEGAKLKLSEVELVAPIPNPRRNVFCVGRNYYEHAQEFHDSGFDATSGATAVPDDPIIFTKATTSVSGPSDPIPSYLDSSNSTDYEGELAVIIGKGGRYIAAEHAREHIFGYSIYNEGSVREYQKHTVQYGLGKAFHASAAFGPWIVTADEFGDPYEHQIESRVSGEKMQDASISLMLHRIEDTIEYISSATELKPGDIISTGTPSGNGAGRNPQRFLQDGDTVKITISGIGTLSNPVEAEPTDLNAVACSC